MDADGSHDPKYLPQMLALAEDGADVVVGSRYVPGGGTENWGVGRKLISRGGSLYARTILGIDVRDVTAGFICWRRARARGDRPATITLERLQLPDRDEVPRAPARHAARRDADHVRRSPCRPVEDVARDLRRGARSRCGRCGSVTAMNCVPSSVPLTSGTVDRRRWSILKLRIKTADEWRELAPSESRRRADLRADDGRARVGPAGDRRGRVAAAAEQGADPRHRADLAPGAAAHARARRRDRRARQRRADQADVPARRAVRQADRRAAPPPPPPAGVSSRALPAREQPDASSSRAISEIGVGGALLTTRDAAADRHRADARGHAAGRRRADRDRGPRLVSRAVGRLRACASSAATATAIAGCAS